MLTCTKRFADIPFAHRQHTHPGHCRFIHGHNWAFEFTFGCRDMDPCGFVIDFGGKTMQEIKKWINDTFDHKLVLNESDPFRHQIIKALSEAHIIRNVDNPPLYVLADIITVPDGSCEGLARYLYHEVHRILEREKREVWLTRVTVLEDSKNSATYAP